MNKGKEIKQAGLSGWGFVVVTAVLVVGLGALIAFGLHQTPKTPEVFVVIVIVFGIAVLMLLLLIMASSFARLNLADAQRALGLPEGSIRAIIAISLIMVFISFGIYLFDAVAKPKVIVRTGLTSTQLDEIPAETIVDKEEHKIFDVKIIVDKLGKETITVQGLTSAQLDKIKHQIPEENIKRREDGTFDVNIVNFMEGKLDKKPFYMTGLSSAQLAEIENIIPKENIKKEKEYRRFDVKICKGVSEAASRIAQQLITTVGTLVVAIAGFYFGTRAVAAARGVAVPALPIIRRMEPDNNKDKGDPVEVNIYGKNFSSPRVVKLLKDSGEIPGEEITWSATKINCRFNLKGHSTGQYELVVVNEDGGEDRLPEAFEVIDVSAAQTPAGPPTVKNINPPQGEDAVSVTIEGTGFAEGVKVKLKKAGNDDIDATDAKRISPTEIKCNFDLTDKTAGKWDVVVINPDKNESEPVKFEVK